MKFIDSMLDTAFEGLNSSTIADPQCRKVLEEVCLLLPTGDDIPRVASIYMAFKKRICISSETQQAHKTIDSQSQKQNEALVLADKQHDVRAYFSICGFGN
ncbi:hypothetical protein ZWY2020_054931 [Hordeum vulgare]|nr:hypothetical protein ZWY2020_054931 [Hordeum vulgare]